MQEVKDMVQDVGKEINPNQETFVNHEGLKRVYKPKDRTKSESVPSSPMKPESELEMVKRISENQADVISFIASMKEREVVEGEPKENEFQRLQRVVNREFRHTLTPSIAQGHRDSRRPSFKQQQEVTDY
jgi:hypothetical protein